MAYKDDSKQWFQTYDFPTQKQFAQVFDWLRWIDQQLQLSDVDGLIEILQNKVDKSVALPAPDNLDGTFLVQVTDPATGAIYAVPISALCGICSTEATPAFSGISSIGSSILDRIGNLETEVEGAIAIE